MKSPIRYAGGKTRAIKHIEPFIKTDKLVSPFIGGASLEIHLANKGVEVIGYDIFDILVNYWQIQLTQPHELYEFLKDIKPTKESYIRVKNILKRWDKSQNLFSLLETDYYKEEPINLTNIEGAAYYWFNHNLSYGPMYMGWPSNVYLNEDRYKRMIEKVRDFKCQNLNINVGSFEDVISNHKTQFMYLDPPYYLNKDDNDNRMFKGLYPNANFSIHHTKFNHELLRDLLHSHNGKFVLSYNNCETIRNWYKDYDFYYPKWAYSYGSGETRIGKNKIDNTPKESHEILIIKK